MDQRVRDYTKNIDVMQEISEDEIRKAMQCVKNGKAVVPEGILVEVRKFLREDGWILFFNKLLQEKTISDVDIYRSR